MTTPALTTLALTLACSTGASAGIVVYQQDFENPAAIGPEWSGNATESHGVFTRFTERRTNNPLTLNLSTAVGQAYSLWFDLYIIDSWDAGHADFGGPDKFNVRVNNTLAFSESMDNDPGSRLMTFRDPDEAGHFGFGDRWYDNDAIYRDVVVDFVATGPLTSIVFFGSGLQGRNDESWGIDNVRIAAIPGPGAAIAIALGAAGLTLARRRQHIND